MPRKFEITLTCDLQALAQVIAFGLNNGAAITNVTGIEEQAPLLDVAPLFDKRGYEIPTQPEPKKDRQGKKFKHQVTGYKVYDALAGQFMLTDTFDGNEALDIVREVYPNVTPGSVSGHLSRMEKAGVINRAESVGPGRRWRIIDRMSQTRFEANMRRSAKARKANATALNV